jgi:hypothetical protein
VRIARRAAVENTYVTAWTRNGRARDSWKSAQRRCGEGHDGFAPGDDGDGRGQLSPRHDGAQRAGRGRGEERGAASLDERDQRDHPERDRVEQEQDAEPSHRDSAQRVSRDHQPPAAPVVGREARRQREQGHSGEPHECDEPCLRRRPRERQHEKRIGDRGHLRAAAREQLRGLEQHEVAVPA